MGSTESRKETETNQNNVYMPNLLAKQIIGDPEEIYDGKKDKVKSNNSLIDKDNNQELILIKDNTTNEKEENNKSKEIVDIKNKKTFGNNIFSDINRGQYFNNQNLFISQTADAIKMEITNQKKDIDYRKFKFNGITVIQNLKEYIPSDITKEEIKDMVYTAFGEGLVDDIKYYIPGKTVTRKQANEIINLIESYIREDEIVTNMENSSLLEGVNLVIDLVDLNKEIIKEKMFKGKNPSELQLENTLKNLSGGLTNIKILSIDFQ
jgi:hypothetical protein